MLKRTVFMLTENSVGIVRNARNLLVGPTRAARLIKRESGLRNG